MFHSEQYDVLDRLNPLISRYASRFALLRSDWWDAPREKCRDFIKQEFEQLPVVLTEGLQTARRLGLESAYIAMLDLLEQQDESVVRTEHQHSTSQSAYRVFRMLELASDHCLDRQGAPLVRHDLTMISTILHTFCADSAQQIDVESELQVESLFCKLPQCGDFGDMLQRLASAPVISKPRHMAATVG